MKIKVNTYSKSTGSSIKLEPFFFMPKNTVFYGKYLQQENRYLC